MTHLSAQSISSQTEDWALLKNLCGYMPKSSDTFLHPQLANSNRNKFHLPLNQDIAAHGIRDILVVSAIISSANII